MFFNPVYAIDLLSQLNFLKMWRHAKNREKGEKSTERMASILHLYLFEQGCEGVVMFFFVLQNAQEQKLGGFILFFPGLVNYALVHFDRSIETVTTTVTTTNYSARAKKSYI